MKSEQKNWTKTRGWSVNPATSIADKADLVLIFGETSLLKEDRLRSEIKNLYPKAQQFGCSTAGEICDVAVSEDSVSTLAIHFAKTKVKQAELHIKNIEESYSVGVKLAQSLEARDLSHVLILSVGLNVNGSEIVRGLIDTLPPQTTLSGGLAGDKAKFQETVVVTDKGAATDTVAVLGFYGKNIKVGAASFGGWDAFGPERLVTKAKGNVLYELDGKSALSLYKSYLGKHASDLPGSALLFPLSLRSADSEFGTVRTILAVDEKDQSMTFAGSIHEGAYARLMKANFDRLIDGAKTAAQRTEAPHPDLAILISCVGRKLILKQRVEEEIEIVRETFGNKTTLTGFYSYGEISPLTQDSKAALHNQTMTITTFSETEDENKAA